MLGAVVLAFGVSIPVLVAVVWLGYVPLSVVAWLIVIVPLTLAANFWFSERQAAWLKDYVTSVLELRAAAC